MNCILPEEFDSLVDYAKLFLGANAETEVLRAYMMKNSKLEVGETPTVPSISEFNQMLEDNNIFVAHLHEKPVEVEPGNKAYYSDIENAMPWYKGVRNPIPYDKTTRSSLIGRTVVNALAERLSSNLGVPYEFITKEDAVEITKNANQWTGQPAFYFGNTIYIIPELADAKSVLHEFAHPLVRAISMQNSELFNNLFKKAMATKNGPMLLTLAQQTYPSLAENDPIVKEEVIVMAMTVAARDKSDSAFNSFISDVLYAIKQLLRKAFGKVKVENLKVDTTLEELADMLVLKEFAINTEQITRDDIVTYLTDYEDNINAIGELSKSDLLAATDDFYNLITNHIKLIKEKKDYKAMDAILKDLYQRSDLDEIRQSLGRFSTKSLFLSAEMDRLEKDSEFARSHQKAFLDSMLRLDVMTKRVYDELLRLVKEPNKADNIAAVYYYNNILNSWDEFLDNFENIIQKELQEGNINTSNPLISLTGGIRRKISSALKTSNTVYSIGVSDIIKTRIAPMKEKIDAKYNEIMEYLKKNGASERIIKLRQKDYWGLEGDQLDTFLKLRQMDISGSPMTVVQKNNYEVLKKESFIKGAYLSDEKIDYLMQGKLGDAHALNSFIEGFMYNQDPIVFGFAGWVKDNMTDVFTKAQNMGNKFLSDIKPLLEKAGYNQQNPRSFGERATFLDRRGGRNQETGAYEEKQVYTFINPWKNYRAEVATMNEEIRNATEEAYKTGNFEKVGKLKIDKEKFMQKYFHNDYTDAYYKRYEIFRKGENDEIGMKAEARRNDLLSKIQNLTTSIGISTTNENFDTRDELANLWREYRQLHSNYTETGELKTEEEVKIAERLREFRDASRDIYKYTMNEGLFEESIRSYEDYLVSKGYERWGVPFKKLRNKWIEKNTRIKIKDSFYTRQKQISDKINSILGKLPKDALSEVDLGSYYEKLFQLMSPYRDEDSQPEGTAMNSRNIEEIKKVQQLIDVAKENIAGVTGLTKMEHAILDKYFSKIKAKETITAEEKKQAKDLLEKRSKYGLTKADKEALYSAFAEMAELQTTQPTDYYIDIINNKLSVVDLEMLQSKFNMKEVDIFNADRVLTEEFYLEVVSKYKEFKTWFDANHTFTTKVDRSGKTYKKIQRVRAWSVVRPNNVEDYEIFTFTNSLGQEEAILGLPSQIYYQRDVKDEYVTKKVTVEEALAMGDITKANIDNKGQFLPRLDVEDKRFVNEKFFDIKKNDPDLYNAVMALMRYHLDFQKDSPESARLFLDVPRYRKAGLESRLEYFSVEGKIEENPISRWWRRVRALFRAHVSDADDGYSFNDQTLLMEADMYDDEYSGIPITGLSNLDYQEVSLDLTQGMLRYMISAEKQRKLIEMNPIARALQLSMVDPRDAAKIQKSFYNRVMTNNSLGRLVAEKTTLGKAKEKSIRQKAIDNFIEREFEGKTNKGVFAGDENMFAKKMVDNIVKLSAFGYFALDIPSALKNSFGARIESIRESAAGKYYTPTTYAKGVAWSNKVSFEISLNIYKFGPKSHDQQLVEIFDAVQGRFEEKFIDHGSRSITQDALGGLTWMTSFRKWTELNSSLSIFGAMMYNEKSVTQKINGVEKKISYMDAWETVDGQIKLKEGVDPEWGIGGSKFKSFKNRVQGVNNNLNGSFAKFDYAESDRYLAFRFIIAFKRWWIRMFLNRWQFRGNIKNPRYRFDASVEDTAMGFHLEAIRAIGRGISTRGEYLKYLSPSETAAFRKVFVDIAYMVAYSMLISMFFGFREDDEDKYKKIKERSGPLDFFGLTEGDDFNAKGWLTNHALLLTLQLQNETAQWLPVTSAGLDSWLDTLKLESVSMKNTTDNYKKIFGGLALMAGNSLFGIDDSRAYWKQDEGPYLWQKEGQSKVLAYFLRSLGMTGKGVDPATGVINWVKAANWR